MQTLAKFTTESADREARMKRKIGELAAEVKDLKEELVVSKNSAIAWMQSKTTRNSFQPLRCLKSRCLSFLSVCTS